MSDCLYALPQGCCAASGPWDWYEEGGDSAELPVIARTSAVYFDPHNYDDSSYTHAPTWYVDIPDSGDGRNFQQKTLSASITPLGISDDPVYCWLMDSGLHHVNKWWRFEADAMGLTDSGGAANIAFDWYVGSARFTSEVDGATQTEVARTGDCTWEDWGVPSGATVTEVEIESYRRYVEQVSEDTTAHSLVIRIVNNSNANVVLSGDLVSATLPLTADGSFVTRSGGSDGTGTLRVVDDSPTDYTASSATIRFELRYTSQRGASPAADDILRLDDIQLVIHFESEGFTGTAKIDAAAKTWEWAVTDADWLAEGWPIMGQVKIDLGIGPEMGTWPSPGPDTSPVFGGPGHYPFCHADGLTIFDADVDGTSQEWKIESDGDFSYLERDPNTTYLDENPGGSLDDHTYSYVAPPGNVYDLETGARVIFYNGLSSFVGHAPQSEQAIGLSCPEPTSLPADGEDFVSGDSYTVKTQAQVGPLGFDTYGFPYVSGDVIWSKSVSATVCGDVAGTAYGSAVYLPYVHAGVDAFDASPNSSIAVITFMWFSSYTDDGVTRYPSRADAYTSLVVNGAGMAGSGGSGVELFTVTGMDELASGGTFTVDLRDYYPRWTGIRALHTSELDGDNRCIAFARYPFDDTEEGGDAALREWTLQCYNDAGEEWTLSSRWGRNSQPTGTVTLNTTNSCTITLTAIRGSDPDYDVDGSGDLALTVNVDQVAGGQPEKTSYSGGVLTCEIDITGGHNTVADLIQLIDEGGDFSCVLGAGSSGHDTDTISGSTTGSQTLTGGSESPVSSISTTGNWPKVHDSSDRFMYVIGHPLRVYDTGATDITGRTRRRYCGGGASYPTSWLISHDSTIINPAGEHENRWQRGVSVSNPGDFDYSCIKNSDDVAPAEDEF